MTTTGELSPELINQLLAQGWRKIDIANAYHVDKSTISYHLSKLPPEERYKTPVQLAHESIPRTWREAPARFRDANVYTMIRFHLEFVATGKLTSESKRARLRRFYDRLEDYNVVVEFDPTIPPTLNMETGGWRFPQRTEADGDLIVRLNKYTDIREEDLDLWRMPLERP